MLPPPAPEADIREVEQELDLAIPPGLKAFYRIRNGTGHPADFGWTPEPGAGLPPQGQGTAWLLPMKHAIPPVQHLPTWDEAPHHRTARGPRDAVAGLRRDRPQRSVWAVRRLHTGAGLRANRNLRGGRRPRTGRVVVVHRLPHPDRDLRPGRPQDRDREPDAGRHGAVVHVGDLHERRPTPDGH
ncbi:SMI1/KNR4 family protein [Streptomyces sp. NPDC001797]|uniref:SMI1/KNR4 family protein n=1 Tax=Streptomyces sp. NPDC001797 TaxID=3364610 RepID=UPI0036956E92